jgi:hypothetical protein
MRNKFMCDLRKVVKVFYNFNGGLSSSTRAAKLLDNDRFACRDAKTCGGFFASKIVIKPLALFLFETPKSLARNMVTKAYFKNLTSVTVCYVVWAVLVAILDHVQAREKGIRSDSVDGKLKTSCIQSVPILLANLSMP